MSVTTSNLMLGPATLYVGTFGNVTEPGSANINNTPLASGGFIDVGGTLGGVKLSIAQTYTVLDVDQVVDQVDGRLTGRKVSVQTQMAEVTLANLQAALNGGTVATGSSVNTYDPDNTISATQPAYRALLFDGWGPSQKRRRAIVRKVLSTAQVDLEYKKDGQGFYAVTWDAFYVSSAIGPFNIMDSNT